MRQIYILLHYFKLNFYQNNGVFCSKILSTLTSQCHQHTKIMLNRDWQISIYNKAT